MALDQEKVSELKSFIAMCRKSPQLIYTPELKFFKDYLVDMGAELPAIENDTFNSDSFTTGKDNSGVKAEEAKPQPPSEEIESEEEEEETPDPDVILPETDELPAQPPLQNLETEMTDEESSKQASLKEEAAEAVSNGDFPTALQKYTDALLMGIPTALLFSRRADILLKMKRPMACIKDCSEAVRLNPNNAKCYKTRGKAYRMLGKWKEAHEDLDLGQKLDYDDELWEMQKFVDEKYKKIDDKRRAKERKEEEKNMTRKLNEQKQRRAEAQRRYDEKRDEERKSSGEMPTGFPGSMPGGFPGGFSGMGGMPGGMGGMPGGMGGMPGGMGGADILNMFNDPELKSIFENPKITKAMQEVMSDPSAMSKYQDDPEVSAAMSKLKSKFGGRFGGGAGEK